MSSLRKKLPLLVTLIAIAGAVCVVSAGALTTPGEETAFPVTTRQLPLVNMDQIPILKTFKAFQDIGKQSGQQSIENAVWAYLENNPSILGGLTPAELRFKETRKYKMPDKDMYYLSFVQQKELGGEFFDIEFSYVTVSAARLPSGHTVIHVTAKVFPDINTILNLAQPMPTVTVLSDAAEAIGLDAKKTLTYQEKKIITLGENNTLQLKTLITFDSDPRMTVVIGPQGDEGVRSNVLHVKPPVLSQTVTGTVQGRGYRFFTSPQQPLDILPMFNDTVTVNITTAITSRTGIFSFPGQSGGNVSGRLLGPYADVTSFQGTNLSFSTFVPQNSPTTIDINPTGNNEFEIAQVNAFHHVNIAHDWVKNRTGFTGIDWPIPVVVNNNAWGYCGAGYTGIDPGTNLYLYFMASAAASGCNNYAYDTVIYHEYAHFVDDMAGDIITNSTEARALSEGWGDILATYISGQPVVLQADKYARSVDNDALYPHRPLNEIHLIGNAFSGFAWDLRKNIITKYANPNAAERLILAPLIGNANSIPEAIESIILADDDDNNLANGTPNFNEISSAAAKHQLYPIVKPSSAEITFPARNAMLSNSVNSQVTIQGTANDNTFASYQLSYGYGIAPTNWINIGSPVSAPVTNGTLGTWTLPTAPGTYMLRLVVQTTVPIIKFQYLLPVHVNAPYVAISIDSGDEREPHSDGQSIVWSKEEAFPAGRSVHLWRNGSSVTVAPTPALPTTEELNQTKTAGSKLIWYDRTPYYTYEWRVYDINTMSSTSLQGSSADISNNKVAVIQNSLIIVQDLVTNQIISIGNSSSGTLRKNIAISGNSLIYEVVDPITGDSDVYHYDLATSVERRITNHPAMQTHPDVDGNWVVYEDYRHGNPEIYAYDLTTSTEHRVSNSVERSIQPSIKGGIVAWTEAVGTYEISLDFAREGSDIWYHNLATGQTTPLTTGFIANNYNPVVAEITGTALKLIVWQSTIGGGETLGSSFYQGAFKMEGCNILGVLVQ